MAATTVATVVLIRFRRRAVKVCILLSGCRARTPARENATAGAGQGGPVNYSGRPESFSLIPVFPLKRVLIPCPRSRALATARTCGESATLTMQEPTITWLFGIGYEPCLAR